MPLSHLRRYRKQLAALVGFRVDESDALLELLEDRSCWMLGPVDGSWVIRVPPGPDRPGAHITIYRLKPETLGTRHRHADREETFVLQGVLRDDVGRLVREGESVICEPGTEHQVVAIGEEECICAVLVHARARLRPAG